jgi:hypothetical protein
MLCSVAARLWLRAVSAAVVNANGYNVGSDLSEQFGREATTL